MRGFFKMKWLLLGVLVTFPALAPWIARRPAGDSVKKNALVSSEACEAVVRVPVEVVTKGSAPKWIYIDVGGPEAAGSPHAR